MKKISILYFGNVSSLTGVSTVLKNIEMGFKNTSNYDLKVYTLDTDGSIDLNEENNRPAEKGSLIKKIIHAVFFKLSAGSPTIARFYVWLLYDRNAINIVNKKGEKLNDSDLLFFHDLFTPFYFRKKFRSTWNSKPKVVVLHSNGELMKMLFDQNPKLKQVKQSLLFYTNIGETVIRETQALIFLSIESATIFINQYPQYKEKVYVVPNGLPEIDITKYALNRKSDKIKIVTVGTICLRKGHDIIVDAMLTLNTELRQKIELYILGDGPLASELIEKCDKNNINNIYFIGACRDVNKYLCNADIFLLASRDEGLPMAIIEALRCKLPIIGTKVGGIPNMINNNNGWLITPSVGELVNVLEYIIRNNAKLQSMGEESYRIFKEKFSIENMIYNYQNIFKKILDKYCNNLGGLKT